VLGGVLWPRARSAPATYGGIPSWIPTPKTSAGRVVIASPARPWLAAEGDTVSVRLARGQVMATAVGPAVPEEGQFPVPPTTPCMFTVTLVRQPTTDVIDLDRVDATNVGRLLAASGTSGIIDVHMATLSAKEFLEDGGSPGWNFFVGKELPADLQSGFRGVDADDAGEQAEVVDVPGPGGQSLHREDMAW